MTDLQACAYNVAQSLDSTIGKDRSVDFLNWMNGMVLKHPEKLQKMVSPEFKAQFDDGKPFSFEKGMMLFTALS
jgi:hypothetical protein